MKKFTKGFTLIELLVVIAVIGILSSIVLVSLNSARGKGKNAKAQTEMRGLKTVLETGYSVNGYTTTLLTISSGEITAGTGDAAKFVTSLRTAAPDAKIWGSISSSAYAMYTRLPSKASSTLAIGEVWCVDSTGKAGLNTSVYSANDFGAAALTSCTHQ